jgi:hypothetical protein
VDAGNTMGPISPELALVDPELARRARALLPPAGTLEPVLADVGVAPPTPARPPRFRRETFVRAAAWLAVPSIALNIALLRTDSAAEPPSAATSALQPTTPTQSSSVETVRPVRQPRVSPKHSGVESARHARGLPPRVARRVLRWSATAHTAAYDVIVWRDHRRIADMWTTKPKVSVAAVACHGTTPLAAGKYLWFVYPLVHASPRRYGPLVKWGTLVVPTQPRCARRAGPAP